MHTGHKANGRGYHYVRLEVGFLNFTLEEETGKEVKKISQVIQGVTGEAKFGVLAV